MDALRSGNWKAMIAHYTVFGAGGCREISATERAAVMSAFRK
jgi:hypothetical protein